jgi:23S rRNA-/tRNA-specific pseudouridylate synthase
LLLTSATQRPQPKRSMSVSLALPDSVLVVNGVCYVKPHVKERIYSVRLGCEGKSVALVLSEAFRKASQEVAVAQTFFEREIKEGRVLLERHKKTRDDTGPFTDGFTMVEDPAMPCERGDRIRVIRHLHERVLAWRGPLEVVWSNADDSIRAINKPAGVPVVDEEGGVGTVGGLMGGWRCGHRLDVCVSGVLLMCRGGGAQSRMIRALGPEGKAAEGVRKHYVARVGGRLEGAREICVAMIHDTRQKRSLVVDEGGTATVTLVESGGRYDAESDTTVVGVEIKSGFRHQIRCALASVGHPIVFDQVYGGGRDETLCEKLFVDDEAGSLQQMLAAHSVPWCNKCVWQLREAQSGGSDRGANRAFHMICLHSLRYVVPSLEIDVTSPLPEWAAESFHPKVAACIDH